MIKDINDFEGLYTIDEYGNIYSIRNKKYLKHKVDKYGYEIVHLCKNGNSYFKSIHRLLAEAFIPNENNYNSVDHIDNNKRNNDLSNLRWIPLSENVAKANKNRDYSGWYKKIIAIKDGNIEIFDSIKEASIKLNIPQYYISSVLTNKQKTTKGFSFKYL